MPLTRSPCRCGTCYPCDLFRRHPERFAGHVPPREPPLPPPAPVTTPAPLPVRLRACTSLGPCPAGSGCGETRRACLRGLHGGTVRHLGECQACEGYVARPPA